MVKLAFVATAIEALAASVMALLTVELPFTIKLPKFETPSPDKVKLSVNSMPSFKISEELEFTMVPLLVLPKAFAWPTSR